MTSARRLARARSVPSFDDEGTPAALLVGRCIEVWGTEPNDAMGAFSRWGRVRAWWLESNGLASSDAEHLAPGSPWSHTYLTAHGDADEADRRLTAAGATSADLDRLRAQANRLHARALQPRDLD